MIRPCSPVPFTCAKFIPFSLAIFLAKGDARILPPEALLVTIGLAFASIGSSLGVSATFSTLTGLSPVLDFQLVLVILV